MDELNKLFNDYLMKHKYLDTILAGKDGLAPFMMENSSISDLKINQFNHPPLCEGHLTIILKFELTKKNSEYRDLLRKEFKFNKNKANLDKFINALSKKEII